MSSWLGASVLTLGEWFIKKMPLVSYIYSASKQISSAISPGITVDVVFPYLLKCIVGFVRERKIGNAEEKKCNALSIIYRSKLKSFQGSCHHKASARW